MCRINANSNLGFLLAGEFYVYMFVLSITQKIWNRPQLDSSSLRIARQVTSCVRIYIYGGRAGRRGDWTIVWSTLMSIVREGGHQPIERCEC